MARIRTEMADVGAGMPKADLISGMVMSSVSDASHETHEFTALLDAELQAHFEASHLDTTTLYEKYHLDVMMEQDQQNAMQSFIDGLDMPPPSPEMDHGVIELRPGWALEPGEPLPFVSADEVDAPLWL